MQDIVSSTWEHVAVIKEFAPDYSITDAGLVISNKSGVVLKTRLDRYGYEIVTLWRNGKAFTRKVHRLVAITFVENPLCLETVNHKDKIKTNNKAENLEWLSRPDNAIDGNRDLPKGEFRVCGKKAILNEASVRIIKKLINEQELGNTAIGKLFGVSCGAIYSIRVGKSWTHVTADD